MASLKVPLTPFDHIQGNEKASITLLEYGDYECPYCGKAFSLVKQIQNHFKTDLKFIFRHFPLQELHPYGRIAAEITEFAAQNNRFWEMHDLIYQNQEELGMSLFIKLSHTLNLPVKKLESDLENGTFIPKIEKDIKGGLKNGVNRTPTFFINGKRYNGNFEFKEFAEAIESFSAHQKSG